MPKWGGKKGIIKSGKLILKPYLTGSLRVYNIVPNTGELSLWKIMNEVDDNDYDAGGQYQNISLKDLSDGSVDTINSANASGDYPDGNAPHEMSEFYNYDHDLVGVSAPTNLTYTPGTGAITFTFDEPAGADRVYIYLVDHNGSTVWANQVINADDEGYLDVDASGQTSFTLNDEDDYYQAGGSSNDFDSLGNNDYVTVRYRGRAGAGAYSSYSSQIQGWTSPGAPQSLARSHARTGAVTAWGDGDDGAYTETITWSAPNGTASSYKVTHGPNSSRTDAANTQDVAVSSGTSIAITGINNLSTRYAWVAAVGGGGDTGAYAAVGGVSVSETYFTNLPSNPAISGPPSTTGPLGSLAIRYSTAKQLTHVMADGDLTCNLQGNSGNGTLYVAMGTGDPGTSGTNNNGTGWVQEGTTCTLGSPYNASASDIAFIKFKYETHTSTGTFNRAAHFADATDGAKWSGMTVELTVTSKSDIRLKTNLERIGYSDMNIPIYLFNFKEDLSITYKGVLAQDLLEMGMDDVVTLDDDGYYSVDYEKIDVDFEPGGSSCLPSVSIPDVPED